MKTEYPYYVAVKVNARQLVKVYKDENDELCFSFYLVILNQKKKNEVHG